MEIISNRHAFANSSFNKVHICISVHLIAVPVDGMLNLLEMELQEPRCLTTFMWMKRMWHTIEEQGSHVVIAKVENQVAP